MGQSQSNTSSSSSSSSSSSNDIPNPNPPPPPSSMESLLAEAAAYGDDENESIDAKAAKALECPCIADLRKGPCGSQFSEAFVCFLKSTSEEKGSDCVNPFVALQNCIKTNPDAFPKDIDEDKEGSNKESSPPAPRIIPPTWSVESQSPTSRL